MSPSTAVDIAALALRLVAEREAGKTLCPSEIARAIAPDGDWRALMPLVHEVVEQLAAAGRIEITQRGRVVGPERPRGPYRIRSAR